MSSKKKEKKTVDDEGSSSADEDISDQEDEPVNDQSDDQSDDESHEAEAKSTTKPKKIHRLSLKTTEDFNEKLRKRGVVYIARVPPKMTPTKVKALLSEFSEVTRVYLVEEDPTKRKRRKMNGGGGGKRYVEGWIEFSSKKKAKKIALSLNNSPISTHKRNPHYGDLWNLRYLPKFKWSHLTEKVAYERRVREQKLRVEMMQARRENAAYVQMVETGKKLDKIEERKRKRGEGDLSQDRGSGKEKKDRRRKHRQTAPIENDAKRATKSAVLAGLM